MTWFEAMTLAVLQGLTEFLPISSSGHLAVVGNLFQWFHETGSGFGGGLFFAVMLHVGTLAAIVAYYRRVAWTSTLGLINGGGIEGIPGRSAVLRAVVLAGIATMPAVVVGLTLKESVDAAFENPVVPGIGFLLTATLLLVTSRLPEGPKGLATTTWRDALLVGLAQAVAITPGISRSGSTIAAALVLGFSRPWAVGFSLLMAVPAISGAAVLEIKDLDPALLSADRIVMTTVATVVSGLVGYGAIVWLIRIVRAGRLWYFSVYLVVLSAVVLTMAALAGPGSTRSPSREARNGQGRRPEVVDRSAGLGLDRPGDRGGGGADDLDRADHAGA